MNNFKKKLLFRACHRGCKELDIFIGRFAEDNIHDMNDIELAEFEELLKVADRDVLDWILGNMPEPMKFKTEIGSKLKSYKLF